MRNIKVLAGVPRRVLCTSYWLALGHKPSKLVEHFQPLKRKTEVKGEG